MKWIVLITLIISIIYKKGMTAESSIHCITPTDQPTYANWQLSG